MWKVKLAAALALLLIFVFVFVQNLDPVRFKLQPLGEINVSKTALILVSAALGSVVTLAVQWYVRRGRHQNQAAALPPR